jgi:hypothetical protein
LLLEDWETNPLTVGDLRDHWLQENPPFLGYLSACSTGANEAERLVDEGIHLVSAFQLAGFRHVVGTLWEVSDKHCVDVARVLYETMRDEGMTDVAVCRGLHHAVRAARDGQIDGGLQTRNITLSGSDIQARNQTNRAVCSGVERVIIGGKDPTEGSRDGRVPGDPTDLAKPANDFFWVPYVHFGV